MNIFVFIAEQQKHDMMGCAGWPGLKTPHIDNFARNAVRFTQAVCNYPACLPSRHSFLTGLYPHEIGIRSGSMGNPGSFI